MSTVSPALTASTKPGNSDGTRLALSQLSRGAEIFCSWFMHTGRMVMAKQLSELAARDGLTKMNTEDIRNRKWTDAEKQAIRRASEARAAGLDLPEEEYEDIPRLTEEQLSNLVRLRAAKRKVAVSVRLDPQVLDWLRSKGQGHLTRINDILSNLMEAERRIASGR